jgi:hypothetical protein
MWGFLGMNAGAVPTYAVESKRYLYEKVKKLYNDKYG